MVMGSKGEWLRMDSFIGLLIGAIAGFLVGIALMGKSCETDTALKLSNVMNASMLDCVTHKVITKEQVHNIEVIFHKHIKLNFKGFKVNQDN